MTWMKTKNTISKRKKKLIDYEGFEKYLNHFEYSLFESKEGSIIIRLTDASPYSNIVIEYYDISMKDDSETLSFKYDIIGNTEVTLDENYLGDILVTIIIESLNKIEEKNENRNNDFI